MGRAGSCSGSHSNGISWRALQKSLPGRRLGEELPGICTLSPDLQQPVRIQLPGLVAPGRTASARTLLAAPTTREEYLELRRDMGNPTGRRTVFFSPHAGDDSGAIVSAARDQGCKIITEDKVQSHSTAEHHRPGCSKLLPT